MNVVSHFGVARLLPWCQFTRLRLRPVMLLKVHIAAVAVLELNVASYLLQFGLLTYLQAHVLLHKLTLTVTLFVD